MGWGEGGHTVVWLGSHGLDTAWRQFLLFQLYDFQYVVGRVIPGRLPAARRVGPCHIAVCLLRWGSRQ